MNSDFTIKCRRTPFSNLQSETFPGKRDGLSWKWNFTTSKCLAVKNWHPQGRKPRYTQRGRYTRQKFSRSRRCRLCEPNNEVRCFHCFTCGSSEYLCPEKNWKQSEMRNFVNLEILLLILKNCHIPWRGIWLISWGIAHGWKFIEWSPYWRLLGTGAMVVWIRNS